MNVKTIKAALATALTCLASAALAGAQNLPTPPQSPYPDAESSVDVPLDPSHGPLMRLRLAADFTPSNAVIVAFGTDADNDGDLSPEETADQNRPCRRTRRHVVLSEWEWGSDLLIACQKRGSDLLIACQKRAPWALIL